MSMFVERYNVVIELRIVEGMLKGSIKATIKNNDGVEDTTIQLDGDEYFDVKSKLPDFEKLKHHEMLEKKIKEQEGIEESNGYHQ